MSSEFINFTLLGREFTIYFFGAFLFLGVLLGIIVLYEELKRRKYETRRIFDNVFWILLFGIIGARIGYILLHLSYFQENPLEALMIWNGGLVFSGGFIFGLATALIWLWKRNRKELWGWLDSAMIATLLGGVIGTVGQFVSGVDYGRETSLPWGVRFPAIGDNLLRHPTQIYEFIGLIIAFIVLLYTSNILVSKGKESKYLFPGFIFYMGVIIMFFVRFAVDFFTIADRVVFRVGAVDIASSHITSLVIIIAAIVGVILREMMYKNEKEKK